MPKYQIKDNQSGKTVTIEGATPPTQSDAENIFKQAGLRNNIPTGTVSALQLPPDQRGAFAADQQKKSQGLADTLRTIGLGFIPDAGADVVDLGKGIYGGVTGTNQFADGYNNPLRTETQLTQTRNQDNPGGIMKNVGGDAAGVLALGTPAINIAKGSSLVPAATNLAIRGGIRGTELGIANQSSDPGEIDKGKVALSAGAGAVLEPVIAGLSFLLKSGLTKGGVYNNMEKAASGIEDHPTSITDLETEGKQAMSDRMKSTYDLHSQEANKILRKLLPDENGGFGAYNPATGKLENSSLTPSQLLELRSRLSPEASQNYAQRLFGFLGQKMNPQADLEAKVADSLRSVVSDRLKEAAPNITSLDKLYGIYNNPAIGPASTWIPRLLIGLLGAKAAAPVISGLMK